MQCICHNTMFTVSVTIVNPWKMLICGLKNTQTGSLWLKVSSVFRISVVENVSTGSSGYKLVEITETFVFFIGEIKQFDHVIVTGQRVSVAYLF